MTTAGNRQIAKTRVASAEHFAEDHSCLASCASFGADRDAREGKGLVGPLAPLPSRVSQGGDAWMLSKLTYTYVVMKKTLSTTKQSMTPRLLGSYYRRWNFRKSSSTRLTEVPHSPHYCYGIGIHPARVRSSKLSALLARFADCYYPRLSYHCESPHLDSGFRSSARAPAQYCQSDRFGYA